MPIKSQMTLQYVPSRTNALMLDYRIYIMSNWERASYFLLAFCVGAMVGFVFYGNLFCENGIPTSLTRISNIVICMGCGIFTGIMFLPMRTRQLRRKRQAALRNQFRDLLAALAASLTAGKNVVDAFRSARADLLMQYHDSAHIILEVEEVLSGLDNNIPVEQMLEDLACRSGNEDIQNFSNVFRVCYQRGGRLKDVVRRTNEIISEKMACADEIETKITSNKSQLNMMCAMPIGIMALFRFTNEGFAENFAQPMGIAAITVGLVIFVFAYKLGQKIIQIGE